MHRHPNRPLIVKESVVEILLKITVVGANSLSPSPGMPNTEESIILAVKFFIVVDWRDESDCGILLW